MITDQLFLSKINNPEFRKDKSFVNDDYVKRQIHYYIAKMQITQENLILVENLIREYGISILMSFEPYYQRLKKQQNFIIQNKSKLQRISDLVTYTCKPCKKCPQLNFFNTWGSANKGFNLNKKTDKQIMFIQHLEILQKLKGLIARIINMKKIEPEKVNQLKIQSTKLPALINRLAKCKFDIFATYYLERMVTIIKNASRHLIQICEKQNPISDYQCYSLVKKIYQQVKYYKKMDQVLSEKLKLEKQKQKQTKQKQIKQIKQIKQNNQAIPTKEQSIIQQEKKEDSKNDVSQIIASNKQTQNNIVGSSFTYQMSSNSPNFSKIPLCCRKYFFENQRILHVQDIRTQFKCYKFPFTAASIETLKKTICSFLNSQGGQIYLGIKQTSNKKYRYVLGHYFTQNDRQQLLKALEKIRSMIFPSTNQIIIKQFIPIRVNPFPQISMLGQIQNYLYDFSGNKTSFQLQKYPHKPGRYVVRIRVPKGSRYQMYNYIQTQKILHKNNNSKDFTPFRGDNEIFVKEPCQEVLRKFKQKLLYGATEVIARHAGVCQEPQKGKPTNQPQPEEEKLNTKQIQAQIAQKDKQYKKQKKGETINPKKSPKVQVQQRNINTGGQINNNPGTQSSVITQQQLQKIFSYPLSFIVTNLPQESLRIVIKKTPAQHYTHIHKYQNLFSEQKILIIKVNSYSYMDQFLRIRKKIHEHFKKSNVQLIGISKILKFYGIQNKNIINQLLKDKKSQYSITKANTVQFQQLGTAASIFIKSQSFGFKMDIIIL